MIHTIDGLRWRLYDRIVSLAPLRVLAERTFLWEGARVRVAALAISHAVQIERGDDALTELLTCGAPPDGWLADGHRAGPWTVAVALERFGLDADVAGEDRLEAHYPDVDGARTVVAWTVDGGTLTVETLHTYPEERAALWSRTVFTMRDGSPR